MVPRARVSPRTALAAVLIVIVAACGGSPRRAAGPRFDFQHGIELFETMNGMRFALVSDHRTNLATIDVRYDVGAAADPQGLSGLAHLVEHLMFELRTGPGQPTLGDQLRELALYSNANTTWDETHYTSTVPVEQLERVIELEGRRMRAGCDQLDDALIARELDVVLAEDAQRGSESQDLLFQVHALIYGADHPYARRIGSPEVAGVTRAEVCAFIESHYAPHAAYLVITGPFAVDAVRTAIGRTFGPIPLRVTSVAPAVVAPQFAGEVVRARAPIAHPTALVVFPYPRWGTAGSLQSALGARLLASELAELEREHGWIVDTGVTVLGGPRAPVLVAIVEVTTANRLRQAADEVFKQVTGLLDHGDFETTSFQAEVLLDRMLTWDNLLARGSWIADYLQYADHDWFMLDDLRTAAEGWDRHKQEVVDQLRPDHARVVLLESGGRSGSTSVVDVKPTGSHDLVPWRPEVDPAEADQPLAIAETSSPIAVEVYQLANGLQVALAPDQASPIVDTRVVFPVGTAHQPPDQPLVAIAAGHLLSSPLTVRYVDASTVLTRSAVAEAVVRSVDVDEASTTFSTRGLAEASGGFIAALASRIRGGTYDAGLLERVKQVASDDAGEETSADDEDAMEAELRFRKQLFGAHHPYATVTRSYEPALRDLDTRLLTAWKTAHYQPRGATLVVSGRFDVVAVKAAIEAKFGSWPDKAPEPLPDVPKARPPAGPSWLAVAAPGANQLRVRLGFPTGSAAVRDRAARAVLAEMVLDQVRDVREGLGASYGIDTEYIGGVAGSALLVSGEVTADRAAAAVPRVIAAVEQLRDDEAVRRLSFVRARRRLLGQVQAKVAGASTMAGLIAGVAARGDSVHELDRSAREIAQLTLAAVTEVARVDLDRSHMVVELRGRRPPIRAAYEALAVMPSWVGPPDPEPEAPITAAVDPVPVPAPAPVGTAAIRTTPTTSTSTPSPESARPPAPRPKPPTPTPIEEPGYQAVAPDDRLVVGDVKSKEWPARAGFFHGGVEVSLDEFLRVAGHDDEADSIRSRRRVRIGMMIGGALGLAVSGFYGLTTRDCNAIIDTQDHEDCLDANHDQRTKASLIFIAGGLTTLFGINLSSLRPDARRLREYADAHNYPHRPAPTKTADQDLILTPTVTAGGLGLSLGGAF